MNCVICCLLLLYKAGAFITHVSLSNRAMSSSWQEERKSLTNCRARQQPKLRSQKSDCRVAGHYNTAICKSTAQDSNTDANPIEDDSTDVSAGVPDFDLEELMKGLNIGSPRKTSGASSTVGSEINEMKLIMALRKQMGEEDFKAIFDCRNPRIGDL
ncbi:unnamed protein product [Ascophyllum nodosum]